MISPLRKPQRQFLPQRVPDPKIKRLPRKASSMTIALGMLYGGGAIVAADSQLVYQDGSKTRGRKVCKVNLAHIAFAIAESSDDANAADTLVRSIAGRLGDPKTISWIKFESEIASQMTEWHSAYGHSTPPVTKLIIGATIPKAGTRIYFCEPPCTVLHKKDGYASAGSGAAITDALFKMLFTPFFTTQNIQIVLRILAYLMYRTKGIEGNFYCGGPTDAVFVDTAKSFADWIYSPDLEAAEAGSFQLDVILGQAAMLALTQSNEWLDQNLGHIGDVIRHCEKLREVVFHDIGDKILGKT